MTNTASPCIPAPFNGTILHVYGLSYSTDVLLGGVNLQQAKTGLTTATQVSDPNSRNNTLTIPNLENYYNVTTLHNAGYTGQGISIGILGAGEAVNMSSVSKFWNTYGIHNPTLKFVNLTSNRLNPYQEGFETDLDVEWSGAMTPNATIYDIMIPFNITGIGDNAINPANSHTPLSDGHDVPVHRLCWRSLHPAEQYGRSSQRERLAPA